MVKLIQYYKMYFGILNLFKNLRISNYSFSGDKQKPQSTTLCRLFILFRSVHSLSKVAESSESLSLGNWPGRQINRYLRALAVLFRSRILSVIVIVIVGNKKIKCTSCWIKWYQFSVMCIYMAYISCGRATYNEQSESSILLRAEFYVISLLNPLYHTRSRFINGKTSGSRVAPLGALLSLNNWRSMR